METIETPVLVSYPPAPCNGGSQICQRAGAHVWQPKIDDRRVAIHPLTGTIFNQYGSLSVAHAQPEKFAPALDELRCIAVKVAMQFVDRDLWLDCGIMEYRHDMMRGCIIVFDLMDFTMTFDERRSWLEERFNVLPAATEIVAHRETYGLNRVWLINQWEGYGDTICNPPVNLWSFLQEENKAIGRKFYEGVVAKRRDSRYPLCHKAKQTVTCWVKHRFDQ